MMDRRAFMKAGCVVPVAGTLKKICEGMEAAFREHEKVTIHIEGELLDDAFAERLTTRIGDLVESQDIRICTEKA